MAGEKNIERVLGEKVGAVLPAAEKIKNPESRVERAILPPEKPRSRHELTPPVRKSPAAAIAPLSDEERRRVAAIDDILSAGLNEIFLRLKPDEQQVFKKKGDETVVKINGLLNKTKVQVNKIIALIRDWLKLIPGVNRFFLEQEAKIKADQIIKIKDKF